MNIGVWESLDNTALTEFYSGALCAGFVNAHCHAELSFLRGAIAEGTGFGGFAQAIGRTRGTFSRQEQERALALADAAMWSEGVEVVADIINGDLSFDRKRRSRITYYNFAEVFGLSATTEQVQKLLAESNTSLTPHSTYSVQEAVFREIAEAQSAAPLSIHFMESFDEVALYRGEGNLAAWYEKMGWECDFLHYGSPTRRLIESIPHQRGVLLVHNCCCTAEDIRLLDEAFGERASWVLCPRSNRYISGLQPPVELLRRAGVRICIGTDSLASNHSLSIVEEMKCLKEVPLRELVMWATQHGAEALGVADSKGSIRKGEAAGVVLIEGLRQDQAGELFLTEGSSARRLV